MKTDDYKQVREIQLLSEEKKLKNILRQRKKEAVHVTHIGLPAFLSKPSEHRIQELP